MFEAPVLLLVLLLNYVVLDFVLPLQRFLATTPGRFGQALAMGILALVHGLAVLLVLGLLREDHRLALLAAVSVALSRVAVCVVIDRIGLGLATSFIAKQVALLSVLIAVWLTSEGYLAKVPGYLVDLLTTRNLLIALAYLLILRPASTLIGSILSPWIKEIDNSGSLANAGALIGYLERGLILTFVLLAQWEAIGFLLTAKSILRFNEIQNAKVRSLSEYVLLGTLLSFSLSIGIGLAVVRMLDW